MNISPGWVGGGVSVTLLACSSIARQHMLYLACAPLHTCRGYGSDMMAQEDVAVVCALALLLRLGRFPEPDGFAELRPLFRVSVYTLDAYLFGLCVDVRAPVQRFVVETTLQVERSWVNWDLVSAACIRLFGHSIQVESTRSGRSAGNLAAGSPYIPLYMKAFQWRFCQLSRNLLRDTGFALSSATV